MIGPGLLSFDRLYDNENMVEVLWNQGVLQDFCVLADFLIMQEYKSVNDQVWNYF
jgi:hypothetical protein